MNKKRMAIAIIGIICLVIGGIFVLPMFLSILISFFLSVLGLFIGLLPWEEFPSILGWWLSGWPINPILFFIIGLVLITIGLILLLKYY